MNCYLINTDLEKENIEVVKKANGRKMEEGILEIYPQKTKHSFFGFGGALTEASASVLLKLDKNDREEIIDRLFCGDNPIYRYIRIAIDSSDFSPYQHSTINTIDDFLENRFDFSNEEKFIFPILKEIEERTKKKLPLLFSPWSPPSCMKTNNKRIEGGKLKKECYEMWAKYVVHYLSVFREKGFNVWSLTLQNEPNARQRWDSCIYTAEEERKLYLLVRAELKKEGFDNTLVFYWDHNKERLLSRTEKFLNSDSKDVSGIAFHGYCGDHFEALDEFRREHSDKRVILSEFCMNIKDRYDYLKQLKVYGHEYINDISHGADLLIDWNIILDNEGGPNHVGNFCMAPFMVNEKNKSEKNMAYFVIEALSLAGKENSKILFTTSFDSTLDRVAFLNDDNSISLVMKTEKCQKRKINVRVGEKVFSVTSKPNSLIVLTLEEKDYE